jgi:hypothetical protein
MGWRFLVLKTTKRFVRFEAYIAPHLVGLAAKVRGMSRRLF